MGRFELPVENLCRFPLLLPFLLVKEARNNTLVVITVETTVNELLATNLWLR